MYAAAEKPQPQQDIQDAQPQQQKQPMMQNNLAIYNAPGTDRPKTDVLVSDKKTNIRQENAFEYSADNEYLAQGSKHYKKIKFA
jgi:hypothetical protein